MPTSPATRQQAYEQRCEVRARIARTRRRLTRRADRATNLGALGQRIVQAYPGQSLAAAAATGILLAGLSPSSGLGRPLCDLASSATLQSLWHEITKLFSAETHADAASETEVADE